MKNALCKHRVHFRRQRCCIRLNNGHRTLSVLKNTSLPLLHPTPLPPHNNKPIHRPRHPSLPLPAPPLDQFPQPISIAVVAGEGVEGLGGQFLVGEEEDVELGGEGGRGGGVAGGGDLVEVVGAEEGGEVGDPAVGRGGEAGVSQMLGG